MADKELLNTSTSSIGQVLQDFGNEMQEELRKSLRSKDSNVSFELEQSINFTSKIMGTEFVFQLKLADYYDFVNKGVNGNQVSKNSSSPYRFGNKMPPPSKLRSWVNNRGIAKGKDINSVAFAIAKNMQKEGTKGNHFYDDVVTPERLKQLSQDLTKAAGKDTLTAIRQITGEALKGTGIKRV